MTSWPKPEIPPLRYWPRGFSTDFATGVPDRPFLFLGPRRKTWWKPWTWVTRISIREAAWWHDVGYFLGRRAPRSALHELAELKPWPNAQRSAEALHVIDEDLERDFVASGMHPATAKVAVDVVIEKLGARHYWWATEEEWAKRAF